MKRTQELAGKQLAGQSAETEISYTHSPSTGRCRPFRH